MDIDERAERWAEEYKRWVEECSGHGTIKDAASERLWRVDLVTAFLAGAAQAQQDYVAFIKEEREAGR